MDVRKDLRGSHLVGSLSQGIEELEQHSGVSLDGSHRAGAALLLGEKGVDGLLPTPGLTAQYQSLISQESSYVEIVS